MQHSAQTQMLQAIKRQVEVKGGILNLRAASPDLKAKNAHLAYIEFRKL